MINADYHVHSDFSSDSQAKMEDMIETAISKGLTSICFTDHMDYDFPVTSGLTFNFDPDLYFDKISKLKNVYKGRINVLTGIEIGLKPNLDTRYHHLTQNYDFDFVIGSTHVVNDLDPYQKEYWNESNEKAGLETYFSTIALNVKTIKDFDVSGHLDYAIRYAPSKNKDYSYIKYADYIDEILTSLIERGKGIEVNTSGYKYGLEHPHPQEDIISRYKELGGEILTIGSDAHRPEHIAYDFQRTKEMLNALGFKYYTTFEKRKSHMLSL